MYGMSVGLLRKALTGGAWTDRGSRDRGSGEWQSRLLYCLGAGYPSGLGWRAGFPNSWDARDPYAVFW